jgi:hypothetical protein
VQLHLFIDIVIVRRHLAASSRMSSPSLSRPGRMWSPLLGKQFVSGIELLATGRFADLVAAGLPIPSE